MSKKVIVYGTPTCPYCIKLKQFLKDKKIVFEDIDVSTDQVKAEEIVKKSGQMGVPVLDVDGQIFAGFDKEAIKKILGI